MALNEQKIAHDKGQKFYFLKDAKLEGIFDYLARLQDRSDVEAHEDLLWWVMKVRKSFILLNYSK